MLLPRSNFPNTVSKDLAKVTCDPRTGSLNNTALASENTPTRIQCSKKYLNPTELLIKGMLKMLRMPPIRLNLSSAVSLCTILGASALSAPLRRWHLNMGKDRIAETTATYSTLTTKHRLQPSKVEGKKNMPVWLLCVLNFRVSG